MINCVRLTTDAKLPKYANEFAAGADLYSDSDYTVYPNNRMLIGTGIAMEIPHNYCGVIWDRSGLAVKGITTLAGLIDSDYRGEICVLLYNILGSYFDIKKGDRIAQIVILPAPQFEFNEVDSLTTTVRNAGRFGSTGR